MKKIILTIIILFLLTNNLLALTLKEAEQYKRTYCYIKYLKHEHSDMEAYNRIIGTVLDIINDDGYRMIVLDYKNEIYSILLEKIVLIKDLR